MIKIKLMKQFINLIKIIYETINDGAFKYIYVKLRLKETRGMLKLR